MTAEPLDLWANMAMPPSTPNETSRAAAQAIVGKAGSLRLLVASWIAERGPVAEWELEQALNLSGNTCRPRVKELHDAHVIRRIEETTLTPSGRACSQYVVTELGRRLLRESAQ